MAETEPLELENIVVEVDSTNISGTVKQRILSHLSKRSYYVMESPPYSALERDVCQEGIARSVGISRAHAALALTALVKEGVVEVKQAHIKGFHRKRKVYYLKGVFDYELR